MGEQGRPPLSQAFPLRVPPADPEPRPTWLFSWRSDEEHDRHPEQRGLQPHGQIGSRSHDSSTGDPHSGAVRLTRPTPALGAPPCPGCPHRHYHRQPPPQPTPPGPSAARLGSPGSSRSHADWEQTAPGPDRRVVPTAQPSRLSLPAGGTRCVRVPASGAPCQGDTAALAQGHSRTTPSQAPDTAEGPRAEDRTPTTEPPVQRTCSQAPRGSNRRDALEAGEGPRPEPRRGRRRVQSGRPPV